MIEILGMSCVRKDGHIHSPQSIPLSVVMFTTLNITKAHFSLQIWESI
jgi:hypothetical protein